MTAARRAFHAMLALTTLATLLALIVRVISTVRMGTVLPVPIEGPGLYAIWKVQHGYPAYEWPTRDFFALTLYNFLFYQSYARILALLKLPSEALPIVARLLTLLFAAAGASIQYAATAGILKRRGIEPSKTVLTAFAFCTWFGFGFIGLWAVSARPDVPACVFALAGFAVCVCVVDGRPPARLILAGAFFYLAWAFKQSAIAMLGGACLYFLGVRRSIRDAALIAAPFAALATLTIVLGGDAYRYNILVAPQVAGQLDWWPSFYWYRSVLLPNLPVWVAVAFVPWRLFLARRADPVPIDRDLTSLFVCTIAFAFALGILTLARNGAALNHIIELWVASATFASVAFGAITASPNESPAKAYAAGAVLLLLPLAFTIGQLASSNRVIGIVGLGARNERLALGSDREYVARVTLQDRLRWARRPVYVDDEILAQPWESNDDRYPAIVLDHVFYDAARAQGRLEHDGVLSLIERRHFGTVVAFVPPWYVYRVARSSGYAEVGRVPWLDGTDAVVLGRSEGPVPNQIKRPTRRRTP